MQFISQKQFPENVFPLHARYGTWLPVLISCIAVGHIVIALSHMQEGDWFLGIFYIISSLIMVPIVYFYLFQPTRYTPRIEIRSGHIFYRKGVLEKSQIYKAEDIIHIRVSTSAVTITLPDHSREFLLFFQNIDHLADLERQMQDFASKHQIAFDTGHAA